MSAKKKKPLTKEQRREQRLNRARKWLQTYNEAHVVRGYHRHFKLDITTAVNDMEAIGAITPEQTAMRREAESIRIEQVRKKREERKIQGFHDRFPDSNDQFYFIAGYPPAAYHTGLLGQKWDFSRGSFPRRMAVMSLICRGEY